MYGWLWEEFFQNRQVQAEHSSELLVRGVVVEVHMAGGVDLLLGAELRGCLYGELFADVGADYRVELLVGEENCVFETGCYLAECFCVACE